MAGREADNSPHLLPRLTARIASVIFVRFYKAQVKSVKYVASMFAIYVKFHLPSTGRLFAQMFRSLVIDFNSHLGAQDNLRI
jgi:hypothetical protein